MRLGVNARRLEGQHLGVARYIEYMLKNWDKMLGPSDRVTLFVREPQGQDGMQLSPIFETKLLSPSLTGLLWENILLPRQRLGLDVLFCPSYTVPLGYRGRTVVAIHSLNEAQPGTHAWWYQFTYSQIYRTSAHQADMVIVPSQSTKQDIQLHYHLPADKIAVVPQGVDDTFQPIEDEDLKRQIRERYLGANRPYILFVGKLSQRRNILTLIAAFADLIQRSGLPHSLLLMGPNHENLPLQQTALERGIADRVVQTDGRFSDHRELIAIYNAADLYVNPSLYEGFSLTLVEALACGVPVVTVNRGALPEIAGDAALMVQEPTVEALSEAMERALTDETLRQDLRAKGVSRARLFRYEDTARLTLDVLRQVAGC